MQYSKFLDGEYIVGIAINDSGILITRQEYKAIQNAFKTMPEVEEGQVARLRDADLVWVIFDEDGITREL